MAVPATLPSQLPIDYAPYNGWSIYWLTAVSFFILILFAPAETYAFASGHPENTLSAQFWRVGHVIAHQPPSQWAPEHWILVAAVTLLFAWLTVHFDFGWIR